MSNKAWEGKLLFIFHSTQPNRQKLTRKKGTVRTTLKSMLTKYSAGPKRKEMPCEADSAVFYGYQSAIAVFFNYGHQLQHGKFFPRYEQHIL